MNRRRKLLAGGVATALMALIAPAAFATSVLDVNGTTTPVADVPFIGGLSGSAALLTDAAVPGTCTTGSLSGYATRGVTLAAGTRIGAIDSISLGGPCGFTDFKYPVLVEKSTRAGVSAEWGVYATTSPSNGQAEIPVEIRGVALRLRSTGATPWVCDVELTGTLSARFNQLTQRLRIAPVASGSFPLAMDAFDGSGTYTAGSGISCGGWVYSGDGFQATANFGLSGPSFVSGVHF